MIRTSAMKELNSDSNAGVFLWILRIFQEHFCYKTPLVAAPVLNNFLILMFNIKGSYATSIPELLCDALLNMVWNTRGVFRTIFHTCGGTILV